MGVVEFKVPANELFNLLPTNAKINAGNKLPNKPIPNSHLYFSFGMFFNPLSTQGSKNRAAKNTRPAPNSNGLKTCTIFFINRKDIPQMTAKKIKIDQA